MSGPTCLSQITGGLDEFRCHKVDIPAARPVSGDVSGEVQLSHSILDSDHAIACERSGTHGKAERLGESDDVRQTLGASHSLHRGGKRERDA